VARERSKRPGAALRRPPDVVTPEEPANCSCPLHPRTQVGAGVRTEGENVLASTQSAGPVREPL